MLYSSTFISIVLAFLMFLGYSNQPVEVVQNANSLPFSYIFEPEEMVPSEKVYIEIFDNLTGPSSTEFVKNTLPKIKDMEKETDEIDLHLYFIPDVNDWLLFRAAMSLKCAEDQGQCVS